VSDLLPVQRDRLCEIGVQLKQAREQKHLSLDDVSAKTLIRATILKAIEEGDTRPLPEPVYIKGFIRRFGDLVGLSGRELSESFPWQPDASVPAGFVTSGNIVAVTPQKTKTVAPGSKAAQAEALADPPAGTPVPEAPTVPPADQIPAKTAEAVSVAAAMEDADAKRDPKPDPERDLGVSGEASPAALDFSPASDAMADAAEPGPQPDGLVQSELARPDVDAAYASRAALFDDAIAPVPAADLAAMAELPEQPFEPEGEDVAQPLAPPAALASLPPPPAPVTYPEPEERRMLPIILGLLGLGLGIGVAALALSDRSPQGQQAQPPAETVPATQTAPPAAPAPTEPEETSAVSPGKVVMELEVRDEAAWVIVAVDGVDQLEGLQAVGFQQRWEGNEQIQLWTPRPDLVWISVNGGPQQPFGPLSELSAANPIKTASFKPEGTE
jgi:cytoskeleton protein RodZ